MAYDPSATPSGKCPHAKAAREAAAMAQREADVKASSEGTQVPIKEEKVSGAFDYGTFYEAELDKKHKDK